MMKEIILNRTIRTYLSFLLLISLTILSTASNVNGQKKSRTRLKVYYEKLTNGDKKIMVILTHGKGKKIKGIPNAEIRLTTYDLDNEMDITSLKTDSAGEATLFIEPDYHFTKDEEGYAVIKATYAGNDLMKASKKKVKFMDLNVDISFDTIDSVKLLTVSTFEIDSTGNKRPIGGIKLNIGVERLYSILFLDKIKTNNLGVADFEFPNDIPGDSVGLITAVAKIDDHDDYGTITKKAAINWGTKVDYSLVSNGRSLFGDEAPLWMIISVFVILAGAWYHFFLSIYKLFQLKNSG